MSKYYVYIHFTPEYIPFYVGKGCNNRAYEFKSRSLSHRRITELYGVSTIIVEVMLCFSESDAYALEIDTIKMLRDQGFKLCNVSDGGPNFYTHGPHTDDMKLQAAETRLQNKLKKNKKSPSFRYIGAQAQICPITVINHTPLKKHIPPKPRKFTKDEEMYPLPYNVKVLILQKKLLQIWFNITKKMDELDTHIEEYVKSELVRITKIIKKNSTTNALKEFTALINSSENPPMYTLPRPSSPYKPYYTNRLSESKAKGHILLYIQRKNKS